HRMLLAQRDLRHRVDRCARAVEPVRGVVPRCRVRRTARRVLLVPRSGRALSRVRGPADDAPRPVSLRRPEGLEDCAASGRRRRAHRLGQPAPALTVRRRDELPLSASQELMMRMWKDFRAWRVVFGAPVLTAIVYALVIGLIAWLVVWPRERRYT